jgi:hypothetical protein
MSDKRCAGGFAASTSKSAYPGLDPMAQDPTGGQVVGGSNPLAPTIPFSLLLLGKSLLPPFLDLAIFPPTWKRTRWSVDLLWLSTARFWQHQAPFRHIAPRRASE